MGFCLFSAPSEAANPTSGTTVANTYEVAFSLQTLLPNRLPDLDKTPFVYGPMVGIPVGAHTIQLRALYGSVDSLSLFLLEPALRFNFSTPFFGGYVLAGAQLLHYSNAGNSHEQWGGHLGTGFVMPMGTRYKWQMGIKMYVFRRTLASFEGSFCFLL